MECGANGRRETGPETARGLGDPLLAGSRRTRAPPGAVRPRDRQQAARMRRREGQDRRF